MDEVTPNANMGAITYNITLQVHMHILLQIRVLHTL